MSCYISNLPIHILETIFCKLSTSNLKSCMEVCKSWKDVITDPGFSPFHQHACADNNLILCLGSKFIRGSYFKRNIYWHEYQGEFSGFNLARTCAMEPDLMVDFVNSCNGLVCLYLTQIDFRLILSVSNPVTGEFVYLPQLEYDKYSNVNMCGLGFSSITNQFKAIRIFTTRESSILHAEIYTLRTDTETWRGFGTDSWRSIGIVPQFNEWCRYCWRSFNAFVNGSFHWIIEVDNDDECMNIIYSFNFESEEFRTFSLPLPARDAHGYGYEYADLGVFGDSLYCSCFPYGECIKIWVMRDYGVAESWAEVLIIENRMPLWEVRDFKVIKFENRKILFYVDYNLWLYDPERKSYERVEDAEDILYLIATSHTPSFATIKDLMEGEIANDCKGDVMLTD